MTGKLFQGEPFFLQLNGVSFELLLNAASISKPEAAGLIHRSESLVYNLIAERNHFTPEVTDILAVYFQFKPLAGPVNGPPLIELTDRSLRIVRKSKQLSRKELSEKSGLSQRFIQYLEENNKETSRESRLALSTSLGVQFFVI
jgi:hypothetical protein